MWISEIKQNLEGRRLAIWQGTSGLPPEKEEAYRQMWLRKVSVPSVKTTPSPTVPSVNKKTGCGCRKKKM